MRCPAHTIPGSDLPPLCVIDYGSSPSRCGPESSIVPGQTQDLPASGAFLLHVMCSSTPAGWQHLALTALHMLRSTFETASAPAAYIFRGSIRHPTQSLCMLRGRRCRRLTQHLLPGALLGLPGPVFHRLDCTSFGWRLLRIISGSLGELVGPGVDDGMAINVVDAGHDALLEFVL